MNSPLSFLRTLWPAAAAAILLQAYPVAALPPRGSAAPPIALKDVDGAAFLSTELAPRSLVVVFGELGQEGTRQACAAVRDVLADPRIERGSVVPMLIVAHEADVARTRDEAAREYLPPLVLPDPSREAFGAYHILVVPSVVVISPEGKVTHSFPGFLSRFKEILTTSLLVASGKEPDAALDALLSGSQAPSQSPEAARVARQIRLGEELGRHGLHDLAQARFREALAISPESTPARVGLANSLLKLGRTEDAIEAFRLALADSPDDQPAMLGLCAALIQREGREDFAAAEALLRKILDAGARNAQAHYLLGRILEAKADPNGAMTQYRAATELLLSH